MIYNDSYTKRECLINGKRVLYDTCGSDSLKESKEFYGDGYKYIGQSKTYFINNTRNDSKETIYFFVLKNNAKH